MNKTQKSFRKQRSLIFKQICLETEILRKSTQIWTETQLLSSDKLNKGYQILEFGFEIFFFLYYSESRTLTNWQNWNRSETAPGTHLLPKSLSLAQSQGWVCQLWRLGALKISHLGSIISKMTTYPCQNVNLSWGSPRPMNQSAIKTNRTQFGQNPAPGPISQQSQEA